MDGMRLRAGKQSDAATIAALHLRSAEVGFAGIFPPWAPKPSVASLQVIWQSYLLADDSAQVIVAEFHRRWAHQSADARTVERGGCRQGVVCSECARDKGLSDV